LVELPHVKHLAKSRRPLRALGLACRFIWARRRLGWNGTFRRGRRGPVKRCQNVQLSFENINAPELGVYGVDHVAVAEGLGCKAIRVTDPKDAQAAFARARELTIQHSVPVVVEFIMERVTNIAMGTEIDNIVEFEEVLNLPLDDTMTNLEVVSRDDLVPV
jgi:tartronate-semialdehyde synthase